MRTVKAIINSIKYKIKWIKTRRRWYRNNAHNHCFIDKDFDISKVEIGKETYGLINPYFYANQDAKLIIGSYCSIAEGTKFVFGEHNYRRMSTFPFDEFVLGNTEINSIKGPIVVKDDVWIGMNCIILSGVTIGQGAVIGAGSIVSKDVPPYAVYAGNKVIKYRFTDDIVEKMLKIDYSRLSRELIDEYRTELYGDITPEFYESKLYKRLTE